MKTKKIIFAIIAFFLSLNNANAQMDAEAQKAWKDYMTPSEAHKQLAAEVGTWEGETSQWMDPNAPPTKSKATNVVKMKVGGLFQEGNFSSSMMGLPLIGQSTTGYDNAKKEYVTYWVDNMGTGMVKMTGLYNEATKTVTLKGTQTDPMTGKDSEIRQVTTWLNADTNTMTMYGAGPDGKEMKFMEGTFKRVKVKALIKKK